MSRHHINELDGVKMKTNPRTAMDVEAFFTGGSTGGDSCSGGCCGKKGDTVTVWQAEVALRLSKFYKAHVDE